MRYTLGIMLQLHKALTDRSVLSLRTGGVIAYGTKPIINPNNLKVEGFYCTDKFSKDTLILLTQDIRDTLPQGFVVNDHDVLVTPEELVRLKDLIAMRFDLMDKPVYTANKKRLGKVNDYAADTETLYIQKFYVSQSLLKSLSGGQLSVDRNQIIEITDRKIVIQDPLQPTKAAAAAVPLAS